MLYGVSDFRIVPVNLSACLQSTSLRECSAESSRARLISALLVRKRCAGHMVLPRHRRHVSMAGSLAPSEAALHSAPLRGTQLPLLISARNARTPRAVRQRVWPLRGRRLVGPPFMPHCHAAESSLNARYVRASGGQGWIFSTLFRNRAFQIRAFCY